MFAKVTETLARTAVLIACVLAPRLCRAQEPSPELDQRVQAPEIVAPQRGSLAGQLANFALGPADVARGGFTLQSPMSAPQDRGPLLANVFPAYAPDSAISEWGIGWTTSLAMTRYRDVGDLDYASDDLTGPYGHLVRGADGYWYPIGLSRLVRVKWEGDIITAYLPDGTIEIYGGANRIFSQRGTYAWYLSSAESVLGRKTVLSYNHNESGRLFLSDVVYGGVGEHFQNRIEFTYESTPLPTEDFRAGWRVVLDRRVKRVTVSTRSTASGILQERWRFDVSYQEGGYGPGYYLSTIRQVFRSGASPPIAKYTYYLATDRLSRASLQRSERIQRLLPSVGLDGLEPNRSALIDTDGDGRLDLERAYNYDLFRQVDGGFQRQPLDVAPHTVYAPCRLRPSTLNEPRTLAQLRANDDTFYVVVAESQPDQGRSTLTVCSRVGQPLSHFEVVGDWRLSPKVRLVDLNRDHQPDLIRLDAGLVTVLPNISTSNSFAFGASVKQSLSPTFSPLAIWVHDFNGDGVPDLIARYDSGVVVWLGKGRFQFEAIGRTLEFRNNTGSVTNLREYAFTFLDANKDGLTDVVLTHARTNVTALFMNRGLSFVETSVPALQQIDSYTRHPVVADLSGSGNTEIAYTRGDRAYTVAIDGPETGLIRSADDGRGTVLTFEYARALPEPGAKYRNSVLSRLTVDSAGQDSITHEYAYAGARLHSHGKYLIGFEEVTRSDAVSRDVSKFLQTENAVGIPLSSTSVDAVAGGLMQFQSWEYDDVLFEGVSWKRLRGERGGWRNRSTSDADHVGHSTVYKSYSAGVCVARRETTSAAGTLTIDQAYATVPRFALHFACLPESITFTGSHEAPWLDFRHKTEIKRNAVGQITELDKLTGDETLVVQHVDYDAEWNISSISAPGRGGSTFEWEAKTGLLRTTTGPDGSYITVKARDPVSDGILTLSNVHGVLSYVQSFRFDDLERLAASWDNIGSGTTAKPKISHEYRYATASLPGLIQTGARVDGESSYRQTLDFFTAAGSKIGTAIKTPQGWAFDPLKWHNPSTAVTIEYNRKGLTNSEDAAAFDYVSLFRTGWPIHTYTRSVHNFEGRNWQKLHQEVDRRLTYSYRIAGKKLIQTVQENDEYATSVELDSDAQIVARRDEAGKTYSFLRDVLGRVRDVILPDGKHHRVLFDGHGRVSRIEHEGVATVDFKYDADTGLLVQRSYRSADGLMRRRVVFRYDAIGRTIEETHSAPSTKRAVQFTYYWDGATAQHRDSRDVPGFLTMVVGPAFEKEFKYRADGKISERTITVAMLGRVRTTFGYFESGDVEVQTVVAFMRSSTPEQWTTVHSYTKQNVCDDVGRIKAVLLNNSPFATLEYDENSQLWRVRFRDGSHVEIIYDPLTKRQIGLREVTSKWTVEMTHRWDARANVGLQQYHINDVKMTRRLQYSPERFLTKAEGEEIQYLYAYDAAGLPESITVNGESTTIVRDPDMVRVGDRVYKLDKLGRVVQVGEVRMTYGADGQLSTAEGGGSEWRYVHDETGALLIKYKDDELDSAYFEEGVLSRGAFAESVQVGGHIVGALTAAGLELFPVDVDGNVIADTDATPRIPSPYGWRGVHPDRAGIVDYASKGYHSELMAVRMGARNYDPALAQFTSPDPLYLEAPSKCVDRPIECNLYGYALNNPATVADRSGSSAEGELAFWSNMAYGLKGVSELAELAEAGGVAIGLAVLYCGIEQLVIPAEIEERRTAEMETTLDLAAGRSPRHPGSELYMEKYERKRQVFAAGRADAIALQALTAPERSLPSLLDSPELRDAVAAMKAKWVNPDGTTNVLLKGPQEQVLESLLVPKFINKDGTQNLFIRAAQAEQLKAWLLDQGYNPGGSLNLLHRIQSRARVR